VEVFATVCKLLSVVMVNVMMVSVMMVNEMVNGIANADHHDDLSHF
jgi:hypothetical protein